MEQTGKITRIVNDAVIYDGLTVEDADKIIGMLEEVEKKLIISNVSAILVDESTIEQEEWYGDWYKCPKCQSNNVRGKAHYCDNCGQKLEYKSACSKSI